MGIFDHGLRDRTSELGFVRVRRLLLTDGANEIAATFQPMTSPSRWLVIALFVEAAGGLCAACAGRNPDRSALTENPCALSCYRR